MRATPLEFAHTLRAVRGSYEETVAFVKRHIVSLADTEKAMAKRKREYERALKVLLEDRGSFL